MRSPRGRPDPGPSAYDAVVVGAGPNGLAAAAELAREGCSVLVLEASDTIGGGTRTAPLTLPGFTHDVCSAVHPMAVASPFLARLPLDRLGLDWIDPPIAVAHPFDDGNAAALRRSVVATAESLGSDAKAYRGLFEPLVAAWPKLAPALLGPVARLPRHPFVLARFGMRAIRSAQALASGAFRGRDARALFAGIAAHSTLSLEAAGSAAVGLVLGTVGHVHGWPLPRGGADRIARALGAYLAELGVRIEVNTPVRAMEDLPPARAYLFDVNPAQLARIVGGRFPSRYRRRLLGFRHGPGVFKVDWALREPIPWRAEVCRIAGTVHVGGDLEEVARSEAAVWDGAHPDRPFVLLTQPTQFDPSRAPERRHVAWAYCHVPLGSSESMAARIERQIERFAPGFCDVIEARHVLGPAELEERNPNLLGGDIGGGTQDLGQIFARPRVFSPYSTPDPEIFLCSASTPPGGGVHGMCGYHAARAALRRIG